MRKTAERLAKEHELGMSSEDYYNYMVDSLINGQRQQVRDLFNSMKPDSKRDFLINFLDVRHIGYHKSILNICIEELTKK